MYLEPELHTGAVFVPEQSRGDVHWSTRAALPMSETVAGGHHTTKEYNRQAAARVAAKKQAAEAAAWCVEKPRPQTPAYFHWRVAARSDRL